MRSRAATEFDHAIGDATKLLEYFDAVHKENHEKAEVLKRAGLVMALTAWETYVEDRVKEAVGARLEVLNGSPMSQFVERRLNDELKRFHNPNAEKSAKLFSEYLSIDVTAHWKFPGYDIAAAHKALDDLIVKRGDAVHRSKPSANGTPPTPHLIKRDELEKAIRFLTYLVEATDKALERRPTPAA